MTTEPQDSEFLDHLFKNGYVFSSPYYFQAATFDDFITHCKLIDFQYHLSDQSGFRLLFGYMLFPQFLRALPDVYSDARKDILLQIDHNLSAEKKLLLISDALSQLNYFYLKINNDIPSFVTNNIRISPFSDSDILEDPLSLAKPMLIEYFSNIHEFILRLIEMLTLIKEKIEKSNRNDLIDIHFSDSDPTQPTHRKPLQFFTFIIQGNGFNILKNEFIPDKYELSLGEVVFDHDNETRTPVEYNSEHHLVSGKPVSFTEHLVKRLSKEYKISLKLIEDFVDHFNLSNKTITSQYLEIIFNDLDYLINLYPRKKYLHKYPECLNTLNALKSFISERYESYINLSFGESDITQQAETIQTSSPHQTTQASTITFKWKKSQRQLELLHTLLTTGDDPLMVADLETFKSAFSGTFSSSSKLVWKPEQNVNGTFSMQKQSLFHLFWSLFKKDYIGIDLPAQKPKAKKKEDALIKLFFIRFLTNIITDKNNKVFQHKDFKFIIHKYYNGLLKGTPTEMARIDEILITLSKPS